jgi:hypothetical protein
MLDAKELAERLRAAMDLREPPLLSSELARTCGVSKQAVYEWRTTGRMGKAHLTTVAQETGMPLEFFLEPDRGSSPTTKVIWRKLGKAFAKVAMLATLTLAFLVPHPAEAGALHKSFFAPDLNGIYIALRRWLAAFLTNFQRRMGFT